MALSVQIDMQGPDWPLGSIIVTAPSTPVGIMSLVDPESEDDPSAPNTGIEAAEYTVRFSQIIFQGVRSNAGTGTVANTGNIYIVRKGVQGLGNRTDYGSIIKVLSPGETWVLAPNQFRGACFSPYRYSLDADNANDAAQVTGLV